MNNEILEGNKLIAEFLGIKTKVYSDSPSMVYYDYNGFMNTVEQMKYHSSWDWLCPVYTKIGTMDELNAYPSPSKLRRASPLFDTIEIFWNEAVDFIQWYNS